MQLDIVYAVQTHEAKGLNTNLLCCVIVKLYESTKETNEMQRAIRRRHVVVYDKLKCCWLHEVCWAFVH